MDRLALILTLISGSMITGTLVVTAFSLDYYAWWTVLGSAAIGYGMAWPSARLISKRIKRDDPAWTLEEPDGLLPKPGGREM